MKRSNKIGIRGWSDLKLRDNGNVFDTPISHTVPIYFNPCTAAAVQEQKE